MWRASQLYNIDFAKNVSFLFFKMFLEAHNGRSFLRMITIHLQHKKTTVAYKPDKSVEKQ
mgnify:FL=1